MNMFDDANVISVYTLDQAVEDGVLVEIVKNRWPELSGGKPIVATANIFSDVSMDGLMEIWNEFVDWKKEVEPNVKEEDRFFSTTMNGKKVWVIQDGQALT